MSECTCVCVRLQVGAERTNRHALLHMASDRVWHAELRVLAGWQWRGGAGEECQEAAATCTPRRERGDFCFPRSCWVAVTATTDRGLWRGGVFCFLPAGRLKHFLTKQWGVAQGGARHRTEEETESSTDKEGVHYMSNEERQTIHAKRSFLIRRRQRMR